MADLAKANENVIFDMEAETWLAFIGEFGDDVTWVVFWRG